MTVPVRRANTPHGGGEGETMAGTTVSRITESQKQQHRSEGYMILERALSHDAVELLRLHWLSWPARRNQRLQRMRPAPSARVCAPSNAWPLPLGSPSMLRSFRH